MRKYLILGFHIIIFSSLSGQTVTVGGYISDASTNEKIGDTYIIAVPANKVAISNEYGFFSIRLSKSDKQNYLIFSNVSYKSDTVKVSLDTDTLLNIRLKSGIDLQTVSIVGKRIEPIEQRNEMSIVSIPIKQIKMLPALGGESDIIKAYQLMPGVQSGNEGSSSLIVRGGSNGQNLILIDNTPVYYINHLGGFVSIFNSDAIRSTKLYKGGFPARFGGRLSSVLAVRLKDGNNKHVGGNFSIGLLTIKLMLEGPIKDSSSTFLISYRRFLYDLFMRPITKIETGNSSSGYFFHDLNIKLSHTFSLKNRIYFGLYYGDDKVKTKYKETSQDLTNKSKYREQWGNILATLRWNHLFSYKFFSDITFSFTRYRYSTELNSELSQQDLTQINYSKFHTGVYDENLQADFEYFLIPQYKIRFGLFSSYHTFIPENIVFTSVTNQQKIIDKSFSEEKLHSFESAVYVENILSPGKRLKINLGVRLSGYVVNETFFFSPEPRLLADYIIGKKHAIKLSISKMHQNIHMLSHSGAGVPVDYWYPSSGWAPPEISWQYSIGYATTIMNLFEASIEGFYKSLDNLITFKPGATYFGTSESARQKIETGGTGTVFGADFLIQKMVGNFTGWIGYTWMKNYRRFDNINNGDPYPYKYDRRNDISIVLNYHFSDKIDLSATWVYGTGEALTLPVAKYYLPVIMPGSSDQTPYLQEIYIYTDKNAFRAKPYHRLDIGINFRKSKRWGERVWNISIYNLYNRKNPYSYYFTGETNSTGGTTSGKVYLVQQSLFPIIPSFSYSIRF